MIADASVTCGFFLSENSKNLLETGIKRHGKTDQLISQQILQIFLGKL